MKRFLPLLSSLVLLSGCDPTPVDYYTEARAACNETRVLTDGRSYVGEGPLVNTIKLSPECASALESLLDWDESFFEEPPSETQWASAARARKKIIEALYVLLVYPLELPTDPRELHVFGVGSAVFQSSLLCAVAPDHFAECPGFSRSGVPHAANLNQAFFNYLTKRLGTLVRKPYQGTLRASVESGGEIAIYEEFFESPIFYRASILLHEARHRDGIIHSPCTTPLIDGRNCDQDMGGPQAMQLLYGEALLHGSAMRSHDSRLLMTGDQVWEIAKGMCLDLWAINHLPTALDELRHELFLLDGEVNCSPSAVNSALLSGDPELRWDRD